MGGIRLNVRGINYRLLSELRKFSLLNIRGFSRLGMEFNMGYNYDNLTIIQLKKKLAGLNTLELRKLRSYELTNKRRRMYLFAITNEIKEKTSEKEVIQFRE